MGKIIPLVWEDSLYVRICTCKGKMTPWLIELAAILWTQGQFLHPFQEAHHTCNSSSRASDCLLVYKNTCVPVPIYPKSCMYKQKENQILNMNSDRRKQCGKEIKKNRKIKREGAQWMKERGRKGRRRWEENKEDRRKERREWFKGKKEEREAQRLFISTCSIWGGDRCWVGEVALAVKIWGSSGSSYRENSLCKGLELTRKWALSEE